jgi:hypothetical protein
MLYFVFFKMIEALGSQTLVDRQEYSFIIKNGTNQDL